MIIIILTVILLPSNFNITLCQDSIDMKDSASYYNNLGSNYIRAMNYNRAAEALYRSLEIKQNIFPENDPRLASTYVNIGLIHSAKWEFDKAFELMKNAKNIYLYDSINNLFNLSLVYINLGYLSRQLEDYHRAIQYYENALRISKQIELNNKNKRLTYSYRALIFNNLADVHANMKEYEIASEYFYKAIILSKQYDKSRLHMIYNNLADIYAYQNNNDLAKEFYLMAIYVTKEHYGEKDTRLAIKYNSYANFLLTVNNPKQAYKYLQLARDIYIAEPSNIHRVAEFYNDFGKYFEKTGQTDSALYYYQQSVIAAHTGFTAADITSNPVITRNTSNTYLLSALNSKAEALYSIYRNTGSVADLRLARETYGLSLKTIEFIRNSYQNEESKLFLAENEKITYNRAIQVAYDLYEKTGDPECLNIAYNFTERSKASVLLSAIRTNKAKAFGGVPDSLLTREKDLLTQIAFYDELVYEEMAGNNDTERINDWKQRVFRFNNQYNELVNTIEEKYPRYFALKYDTTVASYRDVREAIRPEQTVIEYVMTDSLLFVFLIDKENFLVQKQSFQPDFSEALSGLLKSLRQFDFTAHSYSDFTGFYENSRKAREILIKPIQSHIQNKELIIVPDDELANLPFELLIADTVLPGKPDYKNLNYLVRDHSISYSYSATLLKKNTNKPLGLRQAKLLAFVPGYSGSNSVRDNNHITRQQYHSNLAPIPGAKEEVHAINRIIGGDIFENGEATERNFKTHARDYDILHLAMHTIIDNLDPMFSKLAFSPSGDTVEDGLLNTHEIYNMNLNADLTVLSSCSSGEGIMQKGEGVISLARGFIYAGCPSIVMTLWEVEDRSGVRVMTHFYSRLAKGLSKGQSLRQAKLAFLDEADALLAHPYFWSSYIMVGDTSPTFLKERRYARIALLTILPAASIIFLLIVILKKESLFGKK